MRRSQRTPASPEARAAFKRALQKPHNIKPPAPTLRPLSPRQEERLANQSQEWLKHHDPDARKQRRKEKRRRAKEEAAAKRNPELVAERRKALGLVYIPRRKGRG